MKISQVNEMRNLDRQAIDEYGITQEILMENAGQAAYFTILKEFGIKNKNFVTFCGVGHNGGDGLVVTRKIYSNGGKVTVFILGDRSKFRGAAKQNFDIVNKLQIKVIDLQDVSLALETINSSDAIIDAIFGTGLDREVKGKYEDVINMINASRKTIFSVDIPSGIHGDTGQIMGTAVKADYTTTFGLPKTGNLLYPGFEYGGKLSVTHISFPPVMQNSDHLKIATNDPIPIPGRGKDTHKGSYGKVLFIAGSSNYLGAPYFAALSFLKAGGGLSYLATPANLAAFIGNKGSEIVFVPQKNTTSGSISLKNKQQLLQFSENVDMVVIGPGLSLNNETQILVRELCTEIKKPLLIDGDGITAIASDPECIKKRKAPTILTPHLGEMARIVGQNIKDISNNKINILQNKAQELNATIVLKGAHSLIGYPDKRVFINLSGNPGMATAGSGDVLTGSITAMHGLGFSIQDAVRIGVFLHGFAGDLAAKLKGEDGLIASDIMDQLPASLKTLREKFHSVTEDFYHSIYII
ncbi:MAG: NAD(P)H-hydrate dehydratase [candidate division Zixibacteria bacterium]|nr:NAD(P)H-hydrate dehydratase [candidate division Zixibacteria bacterium]